MLALRVSVSICIFAIACAAETVRNVERINGRLENKEVRAANVTSRRLWKRQASSGIHSDHIKRWKYFKDTRKIWLWPMGVVPYVIGAGFTTPEETLIWETMNQFNKHTCIKFQSRREERDYIEFKKNDKGCWAFIGRLRGRNIVEFDSDCMNRKADLIHQLMHVLGFYDQHNTPDRDKWLMIDWDNVKPDKKSYFAISKAETVIAAQQPYDFNSFMHLSENAFSKDSFHHSMWPLHRVEKIGPLSEQFNSQDIYKIDKLYADECELRSLLERSEGGRRSNNNRDKSNSNLDGRDEESEETGKEVIQDADQLSPQMICVFWPVPLANFTDTSKKNREKRRSRFRTSLTDSQKISIINDYKSYRRKCPPTRSSSGDTSASQ